MRVVGLPNELAVGDSVRLRADASWSDGRTEDATARVRWATETLACLVTPGGVATAVQTGDCVIVVALGDRTGRGAIVVSVARTFSISGVTRERYGFREAPVPGAVVTIRSGPQAGRAAVSDDHGRFVFDQVPRGEVTLSVRADSFIDESVVVSPERAGTDVLLTPQEQVLRFQHVPGGSRTRFVVDHAGPVRLTVTSNTNDCGGTYETFWMFINTAEGRNIPEATVAGGSCRPGVPYTRHLILARGEYVLIAFTIGGSTDAVREIELKYPR